MRSKPDIWMPLYIGDYLGDTAHLDAERHGCYLLWMMHYWRKGALTSNVEDLVAIGRLRGPDAPSIAQALLNEFFTLNGDGCWHQKRIDHEKSKWQDKSLKAQDKAKAAAEARWKKDAPSIPPSIPPSNAQGNAQAMLGSCPSPSPSPLPLPLSPFPPETLGEKDLPRSGGGNGRAQPAAPPFIWPDPEQEPPSPAAYPFSDLKDEATMVARSVTEHFKFSSQFDYEAIRSQAELQLQEKVPMNELAKSMIAAWEAYTQRIKEGKHRTGTRRKPQDFFGDGTWANWRLWGLRKGVNGYEKT